jgi:hypothetical protein
LIYLHQVHRSLTDVFIHELAILQEKTAQAYHSGQ